MKKHKLLSLLLTSILTVSTALTVNPKVAYAAETNDTVKITILGTSDVHGRFVPWDYSMDTENKAGSLTQIYTAVKQIRNENPNTILVDAGDSIQDNSVEMFNKDKQQPMVVGMNYMGYDIWNMGNHEFNFGLPTLKNVTDQFKGKLLCGNVYKSDGSRFMDGTTIIEKAGIKIGFVGMDTPLITDFEKGNDHLKGLTVKDPVSETKKALTELDGKVDAVVGIMHMGEENENNIPDTGVKDIANACPGLTAVVAGHMHLNVSSDTVNGVLITEPSKYGTALSRIDLTFQKDNGSYKLVSKTASTINMGTYASDKDLENVLAPFHNQARAVANKVIGTLKGVNMVPADKIPGIPEVQIGETPLSDFFNGIQLYYSKADVAALSIDNDKASLNVGQIKKKDISYNYQYAGGETTVYKVTGKDLKAYMEWSADYFNTLKPGDLTISFNPVRRASKYSTDDIFGGVKYNIDLTKPSGKRITNLTLIRTGKAIKDTDTIKLGMNSYRMSALTAKGGCLEGKTFPILWCSTKVYGEDAGTIRNLAIRYIQTVKKGKITTVAKNNWSIVGVNRNSNDYKLVSYLVKKGYVSVPKTADGKYTNVASINKNDTIKGSNTTVQDLIDLVNSYNK